MSRPPFGSDAERVRDNPGAERGREREDSGDERGPEHPAAERGRESTGGDAGADMRPGSEPANGPSRSLAAVRQSTHASSCEVPGGWPDLSASRVIRYGSGGWDGVPRLPYKDGETGFPGVTRHPLAAPAGAGFDVRYFELAAGASSSHERHDHVHVVVVLRGRGRVRLGERAEEVGFGDVVYVAPGEQHQFANAGAVPFGFVCVVDRERDRPVPVEE